MPEQVVTDNKPQFNSSDFKNFLRSNGIKQTLTPPYHAPFNGAAKRSVQIVKHTFEKQVIAGDTKLSPNHRITNVLLMYHTTTYSVTGKTPAELFMKRQLRTRFNPVKPNLETNFNSINIALIPSRLTSA